MKDYIALTKPRVTWLILATTAIGYYFGARFGWSFWTLFHTIMGTGLIASGTAALNQWYEREADAQDEAHAHASAAVRPDLAARTRSCFAVALSIAGLRGTCAGARTC